jgi:actin-like ATPase involved in cell morphogenesis
MGTGRPHWNSVAVYDAATGALLPLDAGVDGVSHGIAHIKSVLGRSCVAPACAIFAKACPVPVSGGQAALTGVHQTGDGSLAQVPLLHLGGDRLVSPAEVTRDIVSSALRSAMGQCGCGEKLPLRACVSVPAYFTPEQRSLTRWAAGASGCKVLKVVAEPTAAAADSSVPGGDADSILVFDWGGGTFDATVLSKSDRVVQVVATHGVAQLGGRDVDRALCSLLWPREAPTPLRLSAVARAKEAAVRTQSTQFVEGLPIGVDRVGTAARSLVKLCIKACMAATASAALSAERIDRVVVVGGSGAVPGVLPALRAAFPRAVVQHDGALHAATAVAAGCATVAAHEVAAQEDAQLEAAAARGVEVRDVMPCSVGVCVRGNNIAHMLKKNTPLPATATQSFVTYRDGQVDIDVKLYTGESTSVRHGVFLAEMSLHGIPPLPQGQVQVTITTIADASGEVTVHIKDNLGNVGKAFRCTLAGEEGADGPAAQPVRGETMAETRRVAAHKHLLQMTAVARQHLMGYPDVDGQRQTSLMVVADTVEWARRYGRTAETPQFTEKEAELAKAVDTLRAVCRMENMKDKRDVAHETYLNILDAAVVAPPDHCMQ